MTIITLPPHPRDWSASDFRVREHKILTSGRPVAQLAKRLKDLNRRAWVRCLPPSVATVSVR